MRDSYRPSRFNPYIWVMEHYGVDAAFAFTLLTVVPTAAFLGYITLQLKSTIMQAVYGLGTVFGVFIIVHITMIWKNIRKDWEDS